MGERNRLRKHENRQERLTGGQGKNSEPRKAIQIRDRIKELRPRVRAGELLPHPENWRVHPTSQAAALRGVLNHVGYASALVARELPDGTLQLIDGHSIREAAGDRLPSPRCTAGFRLEQNAVVPVLDGELEACLPTMGGPEGLQKNDLALGR